MHSQVIQLYMYLFFSISYLFTSLGFFFSFAGQKLLVGLVPCCLFLLYCQCFAYTVNYSLARLSRIYNEERTVSSINQAGNIGYPHAKG